MVTMGSTGFDGFNGNPWFNDMRARQELQLTQNQFNQLSRAYQNAWNQYQQGLQALQNSNVTDAQLQQRMQTLQARFYQTYNRAMDSGLTNQQMRQRYNQLNWQYQGFGAVNDAGFRQRLNLTPAQRQQLAAMGAQWNQQLEQLRQQAMLDPTLVNQQF